MPFQLLPLSEEEARLRKLSVQRRSRRGARAGVLRRRNQSLCAVNTLFRAAVPSIMDAAFIFRGICALTSSSAAVRSEIRVVPQGELPWEVFSPGVRVAGSRPRPPGHPASVSRRDALGLSCARHHAECCWGLVSHFLQRRCVAGTFTTASSRPGGSGPGGTGRWGPGFEVGVSSRVVGSFPSVRAPRGRPLRAECFPCLLLGDAAHGDAGEGQPGSCTPGQHPDRAGQVGPSPAPLALTACRTWAGPVPDRPLIGVYIYNFKKTVIALSVAVLGLHCRVGSSLGAWGPPSRCGARAAHCDGFSCYRARARGVSLRYLQHAGSVALVLRLGCLERGGVLLTQGSNQCPLHRQTDS